MAVIVAAAETTVMLGNLAWVGGAGEEHLRHGAVVPKDKCRLLPKAGIARADKLLQNPDNFKVAPDGILL